ncbi:MAG TPA: uracil-DNA glycosylase family protein [Candidatus Synoicihabitans sp.]|nr:uracil-DNA glycosylase family protein [Candidatus Synoicihabitans sp.]
MHATLTALTEELRRLKAAGVKTVAVSPESLAALQAVVAARRKVAPAATEPSAAPPSPAVGKPPPAIATRPPRDESARPVRGATEVALAPQLPAAPEFTLPPGDKAVRWAWLREHVTKNEVCCANVRVGKKVVLGVGSLDAKLFFCGEAPGAEEEVQGEPFVGPAGQLLTKMIQAMGLARGDVYIGNIMNWRPRLGAADVEQVGNRPPTTEEMAYCLPFLRAQIEIVQPEVIIALGATAAKGLLGPDSFKAVGEVRGRWHDFGGRPLMVTYHPSYILRNQSNRSKRMIWEDLLKVMERVGLPISERQRGYFLDR